MTGLRHTSEREAVEKLAEEFVERHRRGERPEISEYCARLPEHAAEIRELFPALLMMEKIAPAETVAREASVSADRDGRGDRPELLGEYRILREVGHGGMGVVYEAEHVALGRHVALKVLPFHVAKRPQALERFRREARAAAKLHHSNIVPVFEVGEADEDQFYAMQFIPGQSLAGFLRKSAGARQRRRSHRRRRSRSTSIWAERGAEAIEFDGMYRYSGDFSRIPGGMTPSAASTPAAGLEPVTLSQAADPQKGPVTFWG